MLWLQFTVSRVGTFTHNAICEQLIVCVCVDALSAAALWEWLDVCLFKCGQEDRKDGWGAGVQEGPEGNGGDGGKAFKLSEAGKLLRGRAGKRDEGK